MGGIDVSETFLVLFQRLLSKKCVNVKKKHMLTDYFSCYKLNNKSTPPLLRREKITETKRLSNFFCKAKVFIFTGLRTRRPYFSVLAKKKKRYTFSGIFLTEQVLCFRIHLNLQSASNVEDFTMISSF